MDMVGDLTLWEVLLRFLAAFALVGIIIIVSVMRGLDLERELGLAILRAFGQLMLMALVLEWIFKSESLVLVVSLLAGMIVLAALTSRYRASHIPGVLPVTLTAIASGSVITLTLMVLAGVMPPTPVYLIPFGGMTIGNAMNVTSLSLNRLTGEVKGQRSRIESALALGATGEEAMEPLNRQSVRMSLIPTIDNLKTLGIILIPGAMAGMMLGGVEPLVAAQFQIVVFFMILCSNIIASTTAVRMAGRRLINEDHQLVVPPTFGDG